MTTTPPNSEEEGFPKQPPNTYVCNTQLKHDVMMHPQYPRLSQEIRNCIEEGGCLKRYGLYYHDFLLVTAVYLDTGINYPLPNGGDLFENIVSPQQQQE